MDNATAGKNNAVKQSHSTTRFMMTQGGHIFGNWREVGNTVHELDAYNGILNTYTLGVDCVAVLRHRTTTVQETYTVE